MFYERVQQVKERQPLVHNMTNQVVANFVANGLLAIGMAPIMAYAPEEVAEITAQTDALVLNIGTLTTPVLNSMLIAGERANLANVPIVLDPVGVGASRYRQEAVNKLLTSLKISLIRGNAGEIAQLAQVPWQSRGVDSGSGNYSLGTMAKEVAQKYNCVVAISGSTDWLSDGQQVVAISNGQPLMARVTGMGCLLSAICGGFISNHSDVFQGVIAAHLYYGIAGEKAYEISQQPGSFKEQFINQLSLITSADQVMEQYQMEVKDK